MSVRQEREDDCQMRRTIMRPLAGSERTAKAPYGLGIHSRCKGPVTSGESLYGPIPRGRRLLN